jgi:hypothetical protein
MSDIDDTSTDIDLTGIGDHKPDHRRGYLVFTRLPDSAQRAEDATAMADLENRHYRSVVQRKRPATATEKALLAHLGHTVPENLETTVRWLSNGVRNRSWPTLGITPEGVEQ